MSLVCVLFFFLAGVSVGKDVTTAERDLLIRVLQGDDAVKAIRAALDLSRFPDEKTARVLVPFLSAEDPMMATCALHSLIRIGPSAQPLLEELAASENPQLREYAAYGLDALNTKTSLELLAGMHADPSSEVRMRVAAGLGRGSPGPHSQILSQMLNDRYLEVRIRAARSLALVGDPAATQGLVECMKSMHAEVAAQCGRTLAILGEPALVELRKLLSSPSADIRRRCCVVLGWSGSTKAIPWMRTMLKDEDPSVVRYAIFSLQLLGGRQAIPDLKKMKADKRVYMGRTLGEYAAEAIGKLQTQKDSG